VGTGGKLVGIAHRYDIARCVRNSPCGWIKVIVSVLPCAVIPLMCGACPLWYSVAPSMFDSHKMAGECMSG
jgi:hypothetical protein